VIVPEAYQGPTQGRERVTVAGSSIKEALDNMADSYPGLGELMFSSDGQLHRFVSVFFNGEKVLSADLDREVKPTDEIEVFTRACWRVNQGA